MSVHQQISGTALDGLSPSWPIRWEQARGTYSETAVLMSIAVEAERSDPEVFALAYDAATATDADDRAYFIAELEALFEEANPPGYGPADEDFFRDERAERSVWGMA